MQTDLFLNALHPRATETGTDIPELNPGLDQWFTPAWAAELLVDNALEGLHYARVLEPACGAGAMLGAIPESHHAIGVEIDPRMAAAATRITRREVLVGDFRTVDLQDARFDLIVGNPPFGADVIDGFVSRSHDLLQDEGLLALIMPAHVISTTERVMRWREKFAIEAQIIPRALFPRISLPLVWAKMTRGKTRTLVGFLLFDEQHDHSSMPGEIKQQLGKPGTWREAVGLALHAIGGEASLTDIYQAVEPRRPSGNQWWKDKVRQTLGLYYTRVDETHWKLAA